RTPFPESVCRFHPASIRLCLLQCPSDDACVVPNQWVVWKLAYRHAFLIVPDCLLVLFTQPFGLCEVSSRTERNSSFTQQRPLPSERLPFPHRHFPRCRVEPP